MGFHMAGHLSAKGYDVYVYNRTKAKSIKWLKTFKGRALNSLNKLDINFDGVFLCLKNDSAIKEVLFKSNLIDYLKINSFIVDHSTTSLALVNEVISHKKLVSKSISFFDAPVSGGESGAINGKLSIMMGGGKKNKIRVRRLVSSYAISVIHIGANGHGQIAKMINQICITGIIQSLAEALSFGRAKQVDMSRVMEAISNGAAQSWQMDNRSISMVKGSFNFGFALDLMIKDLNIVIDEASKERINLEVTDLIKQKYQTLSTLGYGNDDTSALIRLFD